MRFTCLVLRISAIGLFLISYPFAGLGQGAYAFELKSPAFTTGGTIPSLYTCQGKDISPPLVWSGTPEKTKSFALICDDPDAPMGTWVHWIYYNIPPAMSSLPEAVPKAARPTTGGIQGRSSFGDPGYGGPCPPWGTHRYFFRLYALDTTLKNGPWASENDFLKAIKGHVLAETELMGTYKKK